MRFLTWAVARLFLLGMLDKMKGIVMKIIKEGSQEAIKRNTKNSRVEVQCGVCECQFEAEENEFNYETYWDILGRSGHLFITERTIQCPYCKKEIVEEV